MTAILKNARPLAAALGLLAVASAPAFAADAIVDVPPAPAAPMEVPPVASWGGAYAGVNLGYAFSGKTHDKTGDNKIDTDGFLGGGFVGYNYEMNNFVVGAEGELGYSGKKGDNAGLNSKTGIEGSLRGRLGYAVSPDILVYGTGGLALERLKLSDPNGSDTNTMVGYTVGAGSDIKLTENVFGRVEYRYTDFGSKTFNTGGGDFDAKDRDHRVTFGVGMKF